MKSRHLLLHSGLAILLGLGVGLPADGQTVAKTLDAAEVRSLTMGRTWEAKAGPTTSYWTWNADGTVCLRLNEKTGKCADTGKWRLDDERICYELTWYGEAYQLKSACFLIADKGAGRYAWILGGPGESIREFTVLKKRSSK